MANDYLSGYSLVVRADEYWYLKKKMNNYYFNLMEILKNYYYLYPLNFILFFIIFPYINF